MYSSHEEAPRYRANRRTLKTILYSLGTQNQLVNQPSTNKIKVLDNGWNDMLQVFCNVPASTYVRGVDQF